MPSQKVLNTKKGQIISLSILNQLIEDIKNGRSFVHEIDHETVTDLANNTRYDTRWRIMKITYRRT